VKLHEHTVPFDALVNVFDGETEMTVSSKSVQLKAGMVALLPAGETLEVNPLSRFKMILITVRS
jgi:quercetin dioxygenase-like cupin family protein